VKSFKEFLTEGGAGTAVTTVVESAQCLWCNAFLEMGGNPSFEEITDDILRASVKGVKVPSGQLRKILKLDSDWKRSLFLTSKALFDSGIIKRGMVFHRGSSMVKKIYSGKNEAYKQIGMRPFTDDRWNPSDIWASSKSFNPKLLDFDSVSSLQKSVLNEFSNRTLVGISLKKIANKANVEVKNQELPPDVDDHVMKGVRVFSPNKPNIFSGKTCFIDYELGNLEIRSGEAFKAAKVEIRGKGSRGGSVSWGYVREAIQSVTGKQLPEAPEINKQAKAIASGDKRLTSKFYEMINIVDPHTTEDDFKSGLMEKEASWISAKLFGVYLTSVLKKNTGLKANRIVTKLINFADSKTEDSTVFVKVYQK